MTLQEYQKFFDALPRTQHPRCAQCGGVGRQGCVHLVVDFRPAVFAAVASKVGGCLEMSPQHTSIPIDANTGLPLTK